VNEPTAELEANVGGLKRRRPMIEGAFVMTTPAVTLAPGDESPGYATEVPSGLGTLEP